jgi:hypothetical protein
MQRPTRSGISTLRDYIDPLDQYPKIPTPIERERVMNPLTPSDFEIIFESLGYAKRAFTDYIQYPDEDFRRMQIERVDTAVEHLRELQKE